MSIFHRDAVFPQWEPIPWNAKGPQVDEQERGFYQRAVKPLVWMRVPWESFPPDGIFGQDRNWFVSHDIDYVCTFDNENLVLIRNVWFGFPDPPEWGLASRPIGNEGAQWVMWGHFPDLPSAWHVPDAGR